MATKFRILWSVGLILSGPLVVLFQIDINTEVRDFNSKGIMVVTIQKGGVSIVPMSKILNTSNLQFT